YVQYAPGVGHRWTYHDCPRGITRPQPHPGEATADYQVFSYRSFWSVGHNLRAHLDHQLVHYRRFLFRDRVCGSALHYEQFHYSAQCCGAARREKGIHDLRKHILGHIGDHVVLFPARPGRKREYGGDRQECEPEHITHRSAFADRELSPYSAGATDTG